MLINYDAIIPLKESISRVKNLSSISYLIPPLLTITRSIFTYLRGSISQEFSTVSENSVQGLLVNFLSSLRGFPDSKSQSGPL